MMRALALVVFLPSLALAAEVPAPTPPPIPDKDAVANYWHKKADEAGTEAANLLGIAAALQQQVKALEEAAKAKADASKQQTKTTP